MLLLDIGLIVMNDVAGVSLSAADVSSFDCIWLFWSSEIVVVVDGTAEFDLLALSGVVGFVEALAAVGEVCGNGGRFDGRVTKILGDCCRFHSGLTKKGCL